MRTALLKTLVPFKHVVYTMHFIETCLLNDFGPAFFVGTSGMAKDDLDLSTDVVNATTDLVRIVFAGCNTWGIKKKPSAIKSQAAAGRWVSAGHLRQLHRKPLNKVDLVYLGPFDFPLTWAIPHVSQNTVF